MRMWKTIAVLILAVSGVRSAEFEEVKKAFFDSKIPMKNKRKRIQSYIEAYPKGGKNDENYAKAYQLLAISYQMDGQNGQALKAYAHISTELNAPVHIKMEAEKNILLIKSEMIGKVDSVKKRTLFRGLQQEKWKLFKKALDIGDWALAEQMLMTISISFRLNNYLHDAKVILDRMIAGLEARSIDAKLAEKDRQALKKVALRAKHIRVDIGFLWFAEAGKQPVKVDGTVVSQENFAKIVRALDKFYAGRNLPKLRMPKFNSEASKAKYFKNALPKAINDELKTLLGYYKADKESIPKKYQKVLLVLDEQAPKKTQGNK